jgi:hypothetical protein
MKLRVEHTRLKPLLNEATYTDAFNQIKKGDILVVKTGAGVYKVEVINKFANQISFQWNNQYYTITNNSFDGSNLHTFRLVMSDDNRTKRTTKGPIVKGVYNIIVLRDGATVTSVTPSAGRNDSQSTKVKDKTQEFKQRYDELYSDISQINEGEIMSITTGKLITSGKDKGSLAKNTITTLKFYVKKKGAKLSFMKLYEVSGAESDKYNTIKKYMLAFGPESLGITDEGINITLSYKDDSGKINKFQITNVFGVDNEGEFDKMPSVDIEALMDSPRMRAIMYKNPSILDKLLGRGAKGIIPAQQILQKYGVKPRYKQGGKVKFKFIGSDIRPNYRFNFQDGEVYVGKFTKNDVIKRTGDNRRESMYLKMGENIGNNEYNVEVIYDRIVDGKSNPQKVGEGKIRIIGTNY